MIVSFELFSKSLLFDREFVDDFFASASGVGRFTHEVGNLGIGVYWAFERDDAVLGDDLDIVGVRRQRFVLDHSVPNFGRERPVIGIHFLTAGGHFRRILVALVNFRVVGFHAGVARLRVGNP